MSDHAPINHVLPSNFDAPRLHGRHKSNEKAPHNLVVEIESEPEDQCREALLRAYAFILKDDSLPPVDNPT